MLPNKVIPQGWLYDEPGMELFSEILKSPEYYLMRAEIEILSTNTDFAASFSEQCNCVLDLGSGTGVKAEIILKSFPQINQYHLIDLDVSSLSQAEMRLKDSFPEVSIVTSQSSFDQISNMGIAPIGATAVLLGSTIGNLTPSEIERFFLKFLTSVGVSRVAISFDLVKDADIILQAYSRDGGPMQYFILNSLVRLAREVSESFDVNSFKHAVMWDQSSSSVIHGLECVVGGRQILDGCEIDFQCGEFVEVCRSKKYTVHEIELLFSNYGWKLPKIFFDSAKSYCIAISDMETCLSSA